MTEVGFDAAIVGGGVVGCAIARRLTLDGVRVVLLERGPDILQGASKANSAILHTGFDAPPGSLELACIRTGYAEYRRIFADLGLPLLETDAVLVAWTAEEERRLDAVLARARENGVREVRPLTRAELFARVPGLAADARSAVLIPGEHVIDPWSTPLAYLLQAIANGAVVRRGCAVERGVLAEGLWTLGTTQGPVRARLVVNCAGLFGDLLDRALLGAAEFTIRPRKGQFVVLDKAAAGQLRTIILPVPSERSKGIVVTPTVFGNLLVGPTAEEQDDRTTATVERTVLEGLLSHAARVLPALAGISVTATYAGLRPATESKDYRIVAHPQRRWITVGGIRSTGLTAALGIAAHVAQLAHELGLPHRPLADPVWPKVPNLAEHGPRDWQRPGCGPIVCHCELVTRREVLAALEGPLPARDLGGLKRRTRAMMGRCQGFYCAAAIARLTRGRLVPPLAEVAHG